MESDITGNQLKILPAMLRSVVTRVCHIHYVTVFHTTATTQKCQEATRRGAGLIPDIMSLLHTYVVMHGPEKGDQQFGETVFDLSFFLSVSCSQRGRL